MKRIWSLTLVIVGLLMLLTGCAAGGGNQDATYNAEMEASPSISDGGAEPRSADAVPSDEQLDLGQNPETGTVISEDAKIVIGQELENAFRDPENNKGTNLKEIEMTVYGTPSNNAGMLMFNALLNGDEAMPAVLTILDEEQKIVLQAKDKIKVTGTLVDISNSTDPEGKETEMPIISANEVQIAD